MGREIVEVIKFKSNNDKYRFVVTDTFSKFEIHCLDLYSKREFIVDLDNEEIKNITLKGGKKLNRDDFIKLFISAVKSNSEFSDIEIDINNEDMDISLYWYIDNDFSNTIKTNYDIKLKEIEQSDVQLCSKMLKDVFCQKMKIKDKLKDQNMSIVWDLLILLAMTTTFFTLTTVYSSGNAKNSLDYVEICNYENNEECRYELMGNTYFTSNYSRILQFIGSKVVDVL